MQNEFKPINQKSYDGLYEDVLNDVISSEGHDRILQVYQEEIQKQQEKQ